MDAFTIASAVVSIMLGIYAIWLSIVFYRMSMRASDRIEESSKDLKSTVAKLEKLFDRLYSDTFSVMRDTYSDMRKHIWPSNEVSTMGEEVESRTDDKIDSIRTELMGKIQEIADQAGGADARISDFRKEVAPILEQAIKRSREAESQAREEASRSRLIRLVRAAGADGIRAVDLLDKVNSTDFVDELPKLRDEGIVRYEGRKDRVPEEPGTRIYIV